MNSTSRWTLFAALALACGRSEPAYDPISMDPPAWEGGPEASLWEGQFTSDGSRLNAIAYRARGLGPHPTALLLHGFPGNERNLDLAQAMRRAGWNVVFFHYRGAWGSGGQFSFSGALADVETVAKSVAAPSWAREHRVDTDHIVVVGHSMGGFLALAAASRTPEISCAVSMAGPDLTRLLPERLNSPESREAGRMLEDWAQGRLVGAQGPALMADLWNHRSELDLIGQASGLQDKPVLLIGARSDPIVEPVQIEALAAAYQEHGSDHVELVIMDGDHSFSQTRIALARRVIAFLDGECR